MPVRVLTIADGVADVADRAGQRARIAIEFVPEARTGDILLVHAGVAIGRVEGGA